MKSIKILHLYYDLMNLSGEDGNMVAIRDYLDNQGVKYEIDNLSIKDKIDFNKYSLIYIGNGSRESQELARQDILKYKYQLKKIFNDKLIIATGNSFELFGESIDNKECLKLLPFKTLYLKDYVVEEKVIDNNDVINSPIIAFVNRNSEAKIKDNHFINKDGINVGDFYGTYFLGPLLIRNPYLLNYFMEKLFKKNNMKITNDYKNVDILAYNEYIKNYANKI
jgi:CobQ-like glutamine amidotransferase family enzyme